MNQDQRILFNSTDITEAATDFRTGTVPFAYTTGGYLYIGSILPFNNLWFEMGVANAVAATVSVDMWFGNAWIPAVDVIDLTAGLTQTGRIQWTTDLNKSWDREQYSKDVTGLPSTSAIYNMYWLRMSWNASMSGTTTIKFIGQKFSDDNQLYSYYPDLNNATIRTSFQSGKTDWTEQHYMAAEQIIRDMKRNGVILSKSQILDYDLFVVASCHKVADIVYQAFGAPYFDQLKQARAEYKDASQLKFYNVDNAATGRLTDNIRTQTSTFGKR